MKERLISILCGICLLLCFVAIVSWARSTYNSEGFTVGHRYTKFSVSASEGAFIIVRGKLVFDSPDIEQAWRSAIDPQQSYDWERWRVNWAHDMGLMSPPSGSTLGFGYDVLTTDTMRRIMMPGIHWRRVIVQIPHWSVVLLMGLGPGLWLYRRQHMRRARAAKGLCQRCGFEMGNVYHSCPKCGERAPLPEGFQVIETR